MKIKEYLFFALIITGIILFFNWKMTQMQDGLNKMNTKMSTEFKTLSDGVSARSEVNVVAQPGLFDKIFNTALNKQYNEIKKMIPEAIRKEMDSLQINNSTTTITKSNFIIEGDSAYFLNTEGVITKVAKVEPINGDSSLLIVVPQEIELTTVQANPDPEDNSKVNVFVTAYNKTTGDSLKINKSLTYVLPGKTKKWEFSYMPYVGVNYELLDKDYSGRVGLDPITYHGKKFDLNIFGFEVKQSLKSQKSFLDLKLVQVKFK